nr:reverse transcriptase zinc-binding domain-containing protein [Tanacetum cinerariifolium]
MESRDLKSLLIQWDGLMSSKVETLSDFLDYQNLMILSCNWVDVVSGISARSANNTLWSIIQCFVLGAAVYYIWQERNVILFQKEAMITDVVFKVIADMVRHKLMHLRIRNSMEVVKADCFN